MQYRRLGLSHIKVSAISFGAGPVPMLMTRPDADTLQRDTIRRALEAGINWFDTAATYGDGRSEAALGKTLQELHAGPLAQIATKVRIPPEQGGRIRPYIRDSVAASLKRLRVPCLTLLQLHNSITSERGAQPTSLTPEDVLGPGGVLETFHDLRARGLVAHFGLTGIGEPAALTEVIRSKAFTSIQIPYNLLNPSAGREVSVEFGEVNYGNVIGECARQSMGVFAIRVFAGGALTGQPPSPHTLTTKFFPLDLYERDQGRAAELEKQVPAGHSLPELALRFAVSHPAVTSALVGFSCPEQVDEVVRFSAAGPLCPELLESLATPDVRCPANPEPGADRCPPSAALPGTMIREALRRPGGT